MGFTANTGGRHSISSLHHYPQDRHSIVIRQTYDRHKAENRQRTSGDIQRCDLTICLKKKSFTPARFTPEYQAELDNLRGNRAKWLQSYLYTKGLPHLRVGLYSRGADVFSLQDRHRRNASCSVCCIDPSL